MTRIIFYSNLTNKQETLSTLVQRALEKRHQITILAENAHEASVVSAALWQESQTGFMPNVLASHALVKETPVVIDWQEKQLCQDDILINLTQQQPASFSRFRQLVELVNMDEGDKVAARQRFKFYRDRGYEIKHIDQKNLVN